MIGKLSEPFQQGPIQTEPNAEPNAEPKIELKQESIKQDSPKQDRLPGLFKYTKQSVALLINELMDITKNDLITMCADGNTPALKYAIAKAIINEDFKAIDSLLDRAIGKVPQKTELTGYDGGPLFTAQVIIQPVKSLTELNKKNEL
jgi:hypothetical protein